MARLVQFWVSFVWVAFEEEHGWIRLDQVGSGWVTNVAVRGEKDRTGFMAFVRFEASSFR